MYIVPIVNGIGSKEPAFESTQKSQRPDQCADWQQLGMGVDRGSTKTGTWSQEELQCIDLDKKCQCKSACKQGQGQRQGPWFTGRASLPFCTADTTLAYKRKQLQFSSAFPTATSCESGSSTSIFGWLRCRTGHGGEEQYPDITKAPYVFSKRWPKRSVRLPSSCKLGCTRLRTLLEAPQRSSRI